MTIPPKLLGNFVLTPNGKSGYSISKPSCHVNSGKSWTDQGYPFYSGSAVYTQEIVLDDEFLSAGEIWIEATGVADMAEFIINGKTAEVRPWHPYRCAVSHFLHSGQNTIAIKITNSMKNFLEAEAKPSGLIGDACLIAFA